MEVPKRHGGRRTRRTYPAPMMATSVLSASVRAMVCKGTTKALDSTTIEME